MRIVKALFYFYFIFFCSSRVVAETRPLVFEQIHQLRFDGEIEDAIDLISEKLVEVKVGPEKDLYRLLLGYFLQLKGQWEKASDVLTREQNEEPELVEYYYYFLGLALEKQNRIDEAEKAYSSSLKKGTNQKILNDVMMRLAEIDIGKGAFNKAAVHLKVLERKSRGTVDYPHVIMNLAKVDVGLNNRRSFCARMLKLYSRYPHQPELASWGIHLEQNLYQGNPTGCTADYGDLQTRIKWQLWSGKKDKAFEEINEYRNEKGPKNPFLADDLSATYFLSTGEPEKAVEILRPYLQSNIGNFEFLLNFGSAAARAGIMNEAIGSYYAGYRLAPTSAAGKRALYQSAFLSYQARDYDGAARKFTEFLKLRGISSLQKDAQWNLAWIKYLKGNYSEAHKDFGDISRYSRSDRLHYWTAMSLLRLDRVAEARNIFQKISANKLQDFYTLAARARIGNLPRLKDSLDSKWTRLNLREIPLPSIEDEFCIVPLNLESEDHLTLARDTSLDQSAIQEEIEGKSIADTGSEVEVCEVPPDIEKGEVQVSPQITVRLEKARDLELLGFDDWAKWELYEVEKQTKNKESLKILMNEYSNLGSYNRASSIGQIQFASLRAKEGMQGAKEIWHYTYPKAYEKEVHGAAEEFGVQKEIIWGIMRAESQYKKEAVSPVGAMGLMQVMPNTAEKMAKKMGKKDFVSTELLEPGPAISIGTAYLQRLGKRFDGNIPLVAAAYNAGPHRAMSWLATFGDLETDEFIEHIPFLETRNYVKKVMANCQSYSDLYFEQKNLFGYLADKIPFNGTASIELAERWDDL